MSFRLDWSFFWDKLPRVRRACGSWAEPLLIGTVFMVLAYAGQQP